FDDACTHTGGIDVERCLETEAGGQVEVTQDLGPDGPLPGEGRSRPPAGGARRPRPGQVTDEPEAPALARGGEHAHRHVGIAVEGRGHGDDARHTPQLAHRVASDAMPLNSGARAAHWSPAYTAAASTPPTTTVRAAAWRDPDGRTAATSRAVP